MTNRQSSIVNRKSSLLPFTKMVGTGNDFLIVDARRRFTPPVRAGLTPLARYWPVMARTICDRRRGIGADGLLVLERSRSADARMRIFNADGSEAEMCGNGARCVVWLLADRRGRRSKAVVLETAGGTITGWARPARSADRRGRGGERVRLQMSEPTQVRLGLEIPVGGRMLSAASIDTGVPHLVVGVSDVDAVDVEGLGRALRRHRLFEPRGTNVNFVEIDRRARQRLRVRTYERGVEGETLACGTGVTASAIVHALSHAGRSNGRTEARPALKGGVNHRIEVITRGGDRLRVSFRLFPNGAPRVAGEVVLEGPVRWVCEGRFRWPWQGGQ